MNLTDKQEQKLIAETEMAKKTGKRFTTVEALMEHLNS